jgi:hypothetical protein
MSPVTRLSQVVDAIQGAKAGAPAFCTNFFPTQSKLQAWIDHGELLGEFRDRSAFFTRKDRDFWHLYFYAPDAATLEREIAALAALKEERVTVDLVGSEASLGNLISAVGSAGFRPYTRLLRLARGSQSSEPQCPTDVAEVVWANATDCQAILDLLESSFDRYADQLPMPYEIEEAIKARQVLVVKSDGAIAALLFFETQGFTSTIRYWVVADRFRSHHFGSALMRFYFSTQTAVRRFILWVTAENENAVLKYRHYGYNPDGLVDRVLVNEMIRT